MFKKQKKRLGEYLQTHERAFRTEIILIPLLVLSIKLFEHYIQAANTATKILAILAISLACYVIGLIFVVFIGDVVWRRLIFSLSPAKPCCGVFVQTKGAGGREFAISRIFLDPKTGRYIYRGIAFDQDDFAPAAAWQTVLSETESPTGATALYFSGKSIIAKNLLDYDPNTFTNQVFSILHFTGFSRFRGAGFDYQRRELGKDYIGHFPLAAERIENEVMDGRNIDRNLLLNRFHVTDSDKKAIREYVRYTRE